MSTAEAIRAELAWRELATRGLIHFTRYTFPAYRCNWHHELIAHHLDRVARGECRRLMVFAPPRHGKSELVSRRFPGLILGLNPDAHIIAASYTADLARRMNRDCQRIIDSKGYRNVFPQTTLSSCRVKTDASGAWLRNADEFEVVEYSGGYKSAGVGGGITGRGFDRGLIDDPLKGRKQAESKTCRDGLWDWYWSDFYSRRDSEDAAIALVQTCWHEDDLGGRLLRTEGDEWDVLWLPAIKEDPPEGMRVLPGDPRADGEALWPELFSAESLLKTKAKSARDWASLYQQRPTAATGNVFKRDWFRYYDAPARWEVMTRFGTADLAASKKDSADYTVIMAWGLLHGEVYLLDVHRERLSGPELHPAMRAMVDKWRLGTLWVEDAAMQLAIVDILRDSGLPIRGLKADTDKLSRAYAATPAMEGGKVLFARGAHWLSDLEHELLGFPGANDDQVDTLAYGIRVATDMSHGPPAPPSYDPPALVRNRLSPLLSLSEPEEDDW